MGGRGTQCRQPPATVDPRRLCPRLCALQDQTHFLYKTTDVYAKDCERSIVWNDPAIGIEWPGLSGPPNLAPKDAQAPTLAQADLF